MVVYGWITFDVKYFSWQATFINWQNSDLYLLTNNKQRLRLTFLPDSVSLIDSVKSASLNLSITYRLTSLQLRWQGRRDFSWWLFSSLRNSNSFNMVHLAKVSLCYLSSFFCGIDCHVHAFVYFAILSVYYGMDCLGSDKIRVSAKKALVTEQSFPRTSATFAAFEMCIHIPNAGLFQCVFQGLRENGCVNSIKHHGTNSSLLSEPCSSSAYSTAPPTSSRIVINWLGSCWFSLKAIYCGSALTIKWPELFAEDLVPLAALQNLSISVSGSYACRRSG